MDDAEEALWRRLRHDLRGAYHQIRLCIDAAEVESDPAARLEWLTWLEAAAGRGAEVAAAMERASQDAPGQDAADATSHTYEKTS